MIDNLGIGDIRGLIKIIEAHRNRKFSKEGNGAIYDFFAAIDWGSAQTITKELCGRTSIPSNVLGALQSIKEAREKFKKDIDWKRNLKAAKFDDTVETYGFLRKTTCLNCGGPVKQMWEMSTAYPGRYNVYYDCKNWGVGAVDDGVVGCGHSAGRLTEQGWEPPRMQVANCVSGSGEEWYQK